MGEYHVRFVATAGPKQGATEDGRVTLRPMDDSLVAAPPVLGIRDSTTRHPLVGSAQIDVDALGATRTGELASADMHAPGVLVIERHPIQPAARAEIMLRLGAEANRRGIVRYDGGYFALKVLRVEAFELRRHLVSGGAGSTARGYFCAAAGPAADRRTCETGSTAFAMEPVRRDGGAGNRTLVRVSFQNRVYVRRLVFLPLPRDGAEPTSPWPSS